MNVFQFHGYNFSVAVQISCGAEFLLEMPSTAKAIIKHVMSQTFRLEITMCKLIAYWTPKSSYTHPISKDLGMLFK